MIDIIDLTQEEYQNLNDIQLAMVRAAQAQKNQILAEAEQKKEKAFYVLLKHNVARNTALPKQKAAIDAEAEKEIAVIKEDLVYRLAYSSDQSGGNDYGPYEYPSNPDFNLSPSQRFIVVRNYYMALTSNPTQRLALYEADTLAQSYLGSFYATLYDLLASYC